MTKTIDADLPVDIFDAQVNIPLMHQVVVAQLAAARQGTHSVKSRGEVAGGGRKPYKQKGTGRARQGSIRAPQFTGGGVVHGPVPRDYDQRTPKKVKAAALRGALTDRARNGRIHVVESFGIDGKPSTKTAAQVIAGLTQRPRVLVVVDRADEVSAKSLRNIEALTVLPWDQLNTYDVLLSDDLVFTKGAFDALVEARSAEGVGTIKVSKAATEVKAAPSKPAKKATSDKPVAKKAPAAKKAAASTVAEEIAEAAPQPEGFEIKGNKDSMKYHLPGGRWYDATIAEVWFETEEDAKAAGFTKAGARS